MLDDLPVLIGFCCLGRKLLDCAGRLLGHPGLIQGLKTVCRAILLRVRRRITGPSRPPPLDSANRS